MTETAAGGSSEVAAVTIDRSSPLPFYFQLSQALEQEIGSGRRTPGERLPSEPDLCARYGVSRTTVRQALARLEQRGLISRRKGEGTYVRRDQPGLWLLQSSEGFFRDEVGRRGSTVTSKVVRAERGVLPPWASDALQLPRGAEGATLERLRSVDGVVAMYVVNHLPQQLAEAALTITDPNESLYARLREQAGVVPHGGRRTLEAIAAEEWLAPLLDLAPEAPVTFIESVGWDAESRPFDCYRAWLRTDRIRIDIQVSGAPAAP
jgi:GntR family transcriptional regulator